MQLNGAVSAEDFSSIGDVLQSSTLSPPARDLIGRLEERWWSNPRPGRGNTIADCGGTGRLSCEWVVSMARSSGNGLRRRLEVDPEMPAAFSGKQGLRGAAGRAKWEWNPAPSTSPERWAGSAASRLATLLQGRRLGRWAAECEAQKIQRRPTTKNPQLSTPRARAADPHRRF